MAVDGPVARSWEFQAIAGSKDMRVLLLTPRTLKPDGHAALHTRLSRNHGRLIVRLLAHLPSLFVLSDGGSMLLMPCSTLLYPALFSRVRPILEQSAS